MADRPWPRYTPTPVGKTLRALAAGMFIPVHPHACGENIRAQAAGRVDHRYTPTPVGKTGRSLGTRGCRAVHPHACGENFGRAARRACFIRYTPTPVGKTRSLTPLAPPETVHPHACGENSSPIQPSSFFPGTPPRLWGKRRSCCRRTGVWGTPPRLWGKLLRAIDRDRPVRYTPTPVGKTDLDKTGMCQFSVHPHACGENELIRRALLRVFGTPPRLWGKRHFSRAVLALHRYTPTPVGKTLGNAAGNVTIAVHPHACGEN